MQLLWLRNDLRLRDHPGFLMAAEQNEPLAVVYILPDHWLTPNAQGLNRLGIVKARFLRATLMNLHRNLARENIRLTLVSGNPVERLLHCYQEHSFTLITQASSTTEEAIWLGQLQRHMPVKTYEATTLLTEKQLKPLLSHHGQRLPGSFSVFRQRVHEMTSMTVEPPKPPINLRLLDWMPNWQGNLRWPDDCEHPTHGGFSPTGGEDAGIQQLAEYLEERLIKRPLMAQHNHTSDVRQTTERSIHHISPYLAWGALSPRYIWHRIHHYLKDNHRQAFDLQDRLLQREYHHWSMQLNSALYKPRNHFSSSTPTYIATASPMNSLQKHCWSAWRAAKTGIPMIDAGLKELTQSGFLPHWLRQSMASYFIHDLKLDWQQGAVFFEHHLVDFDAASNHNNWQAMANAKTTSANKNNISQLYRFSVNQQLQQYDADLDRIRQWLPELKNASLKQILYHQAGKKWLSNYITPVTIVYSNEPQTLPS